MISPAQSLSGPQPAEKMESRVKIRVYVVDAHPLIRTGIASLISAEPDMKICGEAGDGSVAFNSITQLRPDIVIMDLLLPGRSGLELIKSIRAFDARIGTIVLTVHDEALYGLGSLNAGARGYVRKGDAAPRLIDAIRSVWRGKVFVSPLLTNRLLDRIRGGYSESGASPLAELSERERDVVELLGRGLSTSEMAASLHLSVKTIETHRFHIKEKLQLRNGTQVVQFCTHVHCAREAGANYRSCRENPSTPVATADPAKESLMRHPQMSDSRRTALPMVHAARSA